MRSAWLASKTAGGALLLLNGTASALGLAWPAADLVWTLKARGGQVWKIQIFTVIMWKVGDKRMSCGRGVGESSGCLTTLPAALRLWRSASVGKGPLPRPSTPLSRPPTGIWMWLPRGASRETMRISGKPEGMRKEIHTVVEMPTL